MKILITGDRKWSNYERIYEVLSNYKESNPTIIHGGASGADMIADKVAKELGYTVRRFFANWDFYGVRAGPIRNERMLKENPDLVIAFHSNLDKSKGTKHMVSIAEKANVSVIHYEK